LFEADSWGIGWISAYACDDESTSELKRSIVPDGVVVDESPLVCCLLCCCRFCPLQSINQSINQPSVITSAKKVIRSRQFVCVSVCEQENSIVAG